MDIGHYWSASPRPAACDVVAGVGGLFRQAQVTQLRHDATSARGGERHGVKLWLNYG